MPRSCKECGLEFDNKILHDTHWKKCVRKVSFVAYTGQDITMTRHENGTFLCYCSHHKCPKEVGFATMDALHKHMKTLKTTWLGPEKKAGGHSLLQTANTTTSTMEITTDAPCPPQMPAIPWDETMNSPSAPSNGNAPMHSPPTALDMSGQVEESAMASPDVQSTRSLQAMEGPSSLMSLVQTPSMSQAATPVNQLGTSMADVRVEPHFIHHPYLDNLNLVVNAEFHFLLRVATSLPTVSGPRSEVHGLALFDALACNFCTTVYTKHKNMREHHGKKHPDMPIPQNWRSCKAQCIKVEGIGMVRQLWEVTSDAGKGEDSREKVLVDKLLKELGEQLHTVQVPTDGRLITPWLLTTRWNEWAKWLKKPTEELRALVALPRSSTAEEEHYKMLPECIQLYFEEALALIDTTDELVLQRLNSPDPAKEGISNTPFHRHMHDSSMKKYVHPIICFFTMLLRDLWYFPDANMEITRLDDMLQEGSLNQSQLVQHIHSILLKVWTTPWSKNKFHIVPDPTESCLALLTLNHDGSFKAPKDVTTLIAKFEYCMRLTFLKEIRARASSDPEVDEADACDSLQPWFTEKNYSTFARLRSLQHRASAIAYSTMSLPRIWWTDSQSWSSLTYRGNPIAFSDICLIFRDVEEKMVDIWENKVLRGLKIRVDYECILDDPSEKSVGYSFMFDPRNSCFQDRARLVRAVVNGQGGFSRFLLRQEEELVWNRAALRGWLQDYAEMQKLLLMRAEMLSGAPSRGSELTAMIYRNTQARDTRNLMVFGKHLTLLGQYSKTTALTGRDKLIPHSLDALTSDLLIQDLALARPFAEIAAKICFGNNEEVTRLYRNHLFVNFNKAFTSDDLSAVMAKHSLPRVQFALTINPWRHIQTAWKRKFKCAMEDVVEMDMEDDIDSLQAGHTRATENRVYGLSTDSLAAAAEDVLPLFLQASTGWQERCQVMPGGSGLPYQQARSHLFIPKTSPTATTTATATTSASASASASASPTAMPSTTTTKTTTTSQHNSSMSYAMDDAMVDKIATQVTERLAPMLTNLIQELVEEQAMRWRSEDRGLVMVPSISMCMQLAQDAGWHHFVGNREAMSGTERQEQYQQWIEGQGSKIMVRLGYIQGQGRAGRDGKPAICHTLIPSRPWKESRKQDETERQNEQAVLDHLYLYGSKRCLRYGVTLFTDGKGVGCHENLLNQTMLRLQVRSKSPTSRHTHGQHPKKQGNRCGVLFFHDWEGQPPTIIFPSCKAGEGIEG
ncbi:hypothetical protein F5141DRAFT_1067498 [Pisolithus sp. B1]|nr:hypothetical protein F5141DRAFT_1067498 [Pisolithus sp. B1]